MQRKTKETESRAQTFYRQAFAKGRRTGPREKKKNKHSNILTIMFSEKQGNVLHGILLIVLFSFSAFYIAEIQFIKNLSLSPLIVGIILGMLYANSLRNRLPETWVPGIKFCSKQILRAGIVLYGFRLTLTDVAAVGLPAIVVDSIIVCGTIFLGIFLGKLLKIDQDTALITSTGSAICGAAAVLGAEPVIKCEGHKTAIAVSTVVIFGTIAMFLYPIMYRSGVLSSLSDTQVAIYTGSTLHEVAHVAGAGNAMDPTDTLGIAGTATITKMIRVMLLAPVLVIMSFALAGRKKVSADGTVAKSKITIPWFAFGFIINVAKANLITFCLGKCLCNSAAHCSSTDNSNFHSHFLLKYNSCRIRLPVPIPAA